MTATNSSRWLAATLTAAACVLSTTAMAQPSSNTAPAMDAQARYEADRQKCQTRNTQDSLETCMREATNARAAAGNGQLSSPGGAASSNATDRCDAFTSAAEKADCVRRVQTPVSGSVSGGGVLRESTTTTVIPAPATR